MKNLFINYVAKIRIYSEPPNFSVPIFFLRKRLEMKNPHLTLWLSGEVLIIARSVQAMLRW